MRNVTVYDERRHCEITLHFNDIDEIDGIDVYFNTPIMFHNFSMTGIAMVGGCGSCSDKGMPRSPQSNIPDPLVRC